MDIAQQGLPVGGRQFVDERNLPFGDSFAVDADLQIVEPALPTPEAKPAIMMQVAALSIFIRVVQRLQSEVPRTPPVVSIRDRKSIGVRSGTKGKMPNPARRVTLSRVLIQPLISTSRPAACPAERKVWNPPQLPGRVVRPLHRARRLAAP